MPSADAVRLSQELVDFVGECPSMYHAAARVADELSRAGATVLSERDAWEVVPGGTYVVTRNGSSAIALRVGSAVTPEDLRFQVIACHTDSPTFKVKAVPELEGPGGYLRLNVEAYGGMLNESWMDRPLGLAGRVLVRTGSGVESRLFSPERDLLVIPRVAPHLMRKANEGLALNRQVDLCPLFGAGEVGPGGLDSLVAGELGIDPADVLGRDLFLTCRVEGRVWGAAEEFVSAPRLDDLQCVFAGLRAFGTAAESPHAVQVLACFDNEEVGSNTRQGAMSTFLRDTLERVAGCLGCGREQFLRAQARSLLVSADNAHAVHPSHPELSDAENRVWLNRGLVVKEAANQHYTTDGLSRAAFVAICERAGVPTQRYANRSDMPGGSTLGNLSNVQLSMAGVDVGLPQLAMHSSWETAGAADTAHAVRAFSAFLESEVTVGESGVLIS